MLLLVELVFDELIGIVYDNSYAVIGKQRGWRNDMNTAHIIPLTGGKVSVETSRIFFLLEGGEFF